MLWVLKRTELVKELINSAGQGLKKQIFKNSFTNNLEADQAALEKTGLVY